MGKGDIVLTVESDSEDEQEIVEKDNEKLFGKSQPIFPVIKGKDDDSEEEEDDEEMEEDSEDETEKTFKNIFSSADKNSNDKKSKKPEQQPQTQRQMPTLENILKTKFKHVIQPENFVVDETEKAKQEQEPSKDYMKNVKGKSNDNQSKEKEEKEENSDPKKEKFDKKFFTTLEEMNYETFQDRLVTSFVELGISQKPLLVALERKLHFKIPSAVQASCIPPILEGHSISASSQTGSGKTAAYLLPILERILLLAKTTKGDNQGLMDQIYCLVVCPTYELANQVMNICASLLDHCPFIRCARITGGKSSAENFNKQAKILTDPSRRPHVLIATPGRLVDHIINTPNFDLHSLQMLVFDEADRLLEFGFSKAISDILEVCPTTENRQTLLFSATMTDDVKKLQVLALHKPIRIVIGKAREIVPSTLRQEFIKIRGKAVHETDGKNERKFQKKKSNQEESDDEDQADDENEQDDTIRVQKDLESTFYSESILLSLLTRSFDARKQKVIVFVNTKKSVDHLYIILFLNGITSSFLHADLGHRERIRQITNFSKPIEDSNATNVLISTEVASRGLDFPSVELVVNYHVPSNLMRYIHRIGRTARAGRSGTAITFVTEDKRSLIKQIVKKTKEETKSSVIQRVVPQETIKYFQDKLRTQFPTIKEIILEFIAQRNLMRAEQEIEAAEEMLHEDPSARQAMNIRKIDIHLTKDKKKQQLLAKKQKKQDLLKKVENEKKSRKEKKKQQKKETKEDAEAENDEIMKDDDEEAPKTGKGKKPEQKVKKQKENFKDFSEKVKKLEKGEEGAGNEEDGEKMKRPKKQLMSKSQKKQIKKQLKEEELTTSAKRKLKRIVKEDSKEKTRKERKKREIDSNTKAKTRKRVRELQDEERQTKKRRIE